MVYASRVIGWYHKLLLLWHREIQLCGQHIRFLHGMHVVFLGLESVFTPTLVGDHLLNESRSSVDYE